MGFRGEHESVLGTVRKSKYLIMSHSYKTLGLSWFNITLNVKNIEQPEVQATLWTFPESFVLKHE